MKRLTLFMRMIAFLTVTILLMVSVSAVEFYNTDGYYRATIYIKNQLNDYQSEFSDAVDAWNSADITDRSIVVNTQSSCYINNFDFHADDNFRGYNTDGDVGVYLVYSRISSLACDCHKATAFSIHINDFLIEENSHTSASIQSVIAHELGHAYGLTDLKGIEYRYSALMYAYVSSSNFGGPQAIDVSNANACWAPHVN